MLKDVLIPKGITKKIILSFSILIFLILGIQLAISYYAMNTTIQGINKNYIAVNINQKNENLNKFFDEIDLLSKNIIGNREIQEILMNGTGDATVNVISGDISYAVSNFFAGMVLISKNGTVYRDADVEIGDYIVLNLEKIQAKIDESNGELCFFESSFIGYGPENGRKKHGKHVFLAARKVRSINSFEDIGMMVMAINESDLWNNFVMEGEIGNFYLADANGNIISCQNKSVIGKNIFNVEEHLKKLSWNPNDFSTVSDGLIINKFFNSASKWSIINIVSVRELNSNLSVLQRNIIIIGITAIIVSTYLSIVISRKITRPIRDLIHSMKKVTEGNLNVRTGSSNSADELQELNDVFNQMTNQLQYLIEQVYQQSIREKETELRALKAQINPHFLYNTLDTIYWMLIEKNDYEVAELVTKLGEILRYSIKKGSSTVKVKEEIQQVKNYLYIQKARFEENLNYHFEISQEIIENDVISFLIQPFVENSINHGIMENKGFGTVTIRGYRKDSRMFFEIIDDGSGMSQEQLDKLFSVHEKEKTSGSGIGITNVNDRIRYLYGGEYGVKIESSKDAGTKVTVCVPIKNCEVMNGEAQYFAG